MSPFTNTHVQNQPDLTQQVLDYYDTKVNDRNLTQSQDDGIINHHFGLWDSHQTSSTDQASLTRSIQASENRMTQHLIDWIHRTHQRELQHEYRILDMGCGRGGPMAMCLRQFPNAHVTGVNISPYQSQATRDALRTHGFDSSQYTVVNGDYLQLDTLEGTRNRQFDLVYFIETTQYTYDLTPLFAQFGKHLTSNGQVHVLTWHYEGEGHELLELRRVIEPINDHYASTMHSLQDYVDAAQQAGLELASRIDLSPSVQAYWNARSQWELASGVEPYFLTGHKNGMIRYQHLAFIKV